MRDTPRGAGGSERRQTPAEGGRGVPQHDVQWSSSIGVISPPAITRRGSRDISFEDAQALREKAAAYAALLRGDIGAESLVAKLGIREKFGVTDGQLYNIRAYRDRKKEFTSLAALSPSADPGLAAIVTGRQDATAPRP